MGEGSPSVGGTHDPTPLTPDEVVEAVRRACGEVLREHFLSSFTEDDRALIGGLLRAWERREGRYEAVRTRIEELEGLGRAFLAFLERGIRERIALTDPEDRAECAKHILALVRELVQYAASYLLSVATTVELERTVGPHSEAFREADVRRSRVHEAAMAQGRALVRLLMRGVAREGDEEEKLTLPEIDQLFPGSTMDSRERWREVILGFVLALTSESMRRSYMRAYRRVSRAERGDMLF